MKAIKTTLAQTGPALYIKALIFGTLAGGITLILLLCICSVFLLVTGTLPHDYLSLIGAGLCMLCALISGYVTSRIAKQKGMICGVLSGIIMFLITLLAGFISGDSDFTYLTLLKIGGFSVFGALGGIKGVNKKERIHIK